MTDRIELVGVVADWVLGYGAAVRLAIDGPDAAGKTTFADELAASIAGRGRVAIRASIDGFHRPRDERYERGELSPEGYYRDSFDIALLRSQLLDPLAPGGTRVIRTAAFDHVANRPVDSGESVAPDDAVLVFDGVFMLRPELASLWDGVVYLDISEEEVLRRAASRDSERMSSPRERYSRRYLPAQRLYRDEAQPRERANVVIDNTDFEHPLVIKAPW